MSLTSKSYCSIDGCEKPTYGKKEWCEMHYKRWLIHGDPNYQRVVEVKVCSVCGGTHYGKGLCRKHYSRLRNTGTLGNKKIQDLVGEEWLPVQREGFDEIFVSNMGRAKSCRKRNEVLLKASMKTLGQSVTPVLVAFPSGLELRIAREVLIAFGDNEHNDSTVIFKDGNGENCKFDNLTWYGRNYLIETRIKEAESSDDPLADCFLRFWHGEHQVINSWLKSMADPIKGYLYRCFDGSTLSCFKFQIEDYVQQALYDVFIALYRGMFPGFHATRQWVLSIARAVYRRACRIRINSSLDYIHDDGSESSLADIVGFTHPSAELVAMCREEGVYA